MNLRMVCGMVVWCSIWVNECMLTVLNIVIVLFMMCSIVFVEWLILKPCCVEMCGILFVIYGSSVFSSVFHITERGKTCLYEVSWFHIYIYLVLVWCLLISMCVGWCIYMLVRYASSSCPMCFRCLVFTLSDPVELLTLLCFFASWTCCGECYRSCL